MVAKATIAVLALHIFLNKCSWLHIATRYRSSKPIIRHPDDSAGADMHGAPRVQCWNYVLSDCNTGNLSLDPTDHMGDWSWAHAWTVQLKLSCMPSSSQVWTFIVTMFGLGVCTDMIVSMYKANHLYIWNGQPPDSSLASLQDGTRLLTKMKEIRQNFGAFKVSAFKFCFIAKRLYSLSTRCKNNGTVSCMTCIKYAYWMQGLPPYMVAWHAPQPPFGNLAIFKSWLPHGLSSSKKQDHCLHIVPRRVPISPWWSHDNANHLKQVCCHLDALECTLRKIRQFINYFKYEWTQLIPPFNTLGQLAMGRESIGSSVLKTSEGLLRNTTPMQNKYANHKHMLNYASLSCTMTPADSAKIKKKNTADQNQTAIVHSEESKTFLSTINSTAWIRKLL